MPRILVVDDDATIRQSVKLVLDTIGIESVPAESGERALDAFDKMQFDGVIIDLMMPGMNGLETICRLRERAPDLPIVLVSGSVPQDIVVPELVRMAGELRGVVSLAKPFRLSELLRTVHEQFLAAAPRTSEKPAA